MMRILIAGLGSIGRRHLRNLEALGVRDFVLLRTGRSTLPDRDISSYPTETEIHRALERFRPTAVVVANPTALHLDVAIPAAEAGCHLLLEKPLSDTIARVDRLRALVQERGLVAMMGFQFRFHPGLREAKRLIESGAIGRVLYAHAHWGEYLPGWHPWEDYRAGYAFRPELGGGVVLTLCHPFDYLRWLIGDVSAVSAVVVNTGALGPGVEDLATINLRFLSGATGCVHLDYLQRPPSHTLQLTGENGVLRWSAESGTVEIARGGERDREQVGARSAFERNDMFIVESAHFLECIRDGHAAAATVDDGIAALELAIAAKAASEQRAEMPVQAGLLSGPVGR